MLAFNNADKVKLWDVAAQRIVRTISEDSFIRSIAFSADSQILAVSIDPGSGDYVEGGVDGTIKLRDVTTGRLLGTLRNRGKTHGGMILRFPESNESWCHQPIWTICPPLS
jgi:WD40 repeat protein